MTGPRPFAVDDGDGIVLGQASSTLGSDHDCNAWTRTLTTGAKGQEGLEGRYPISRYSRALLLHLPMFVREILGDQKECISSRLVPLTPRQDSTRTLETVMNMRARVF